MAGSNVSEVILLYCIELLGRDDEGGMRQTASPGVALMRLRGLDVEGGTTVGVGAAGAK